MALARWNLARMTVLTIEILLLAPEGASSSALSSALSDISLNAH